MTIFSFRWHDYIVATFTIIILIGRVELAKAVKQQLFRWALFYLYFFLFVLQ